MNHMHPRKKYSQFIKISPNELAQKESFKSSPLTDNLMMRSPKVRLIPDKIEKPHLLINKLMPAGKSLGKRSETEEGNILVSDKPQRATSLSKFNSFTSQDGSDDDQKSENDPVRSEYIATGELEPVNEKGSQLLDHARPQKQDVIVKGPKELSCVYEDKPAPRWPLQMNSISPSHMLSKGGKDVDVEENFTRKKGFEEHPDFSLAVAEPVYKADFSNPNVLKVNLFI